jgi:predicted O-methyltransferase YrrM
MAPIADVVTAANRLARALRQDPVETAMTIRDVAAERAEHRNGGFMPWPPCPYDEDERWEESLHDLLGAPWPCPLTEQFSALWSSVMEQLTSRGMALGRGAFAGWGDGEPGLVRAVWCTACHLRPEKVVETGVARGITSRFILEALADTGDGRLWSIDLAPAGRPELEESIGIAVSEPLRPRWSYVRGSSRRRLPGLLARLGEIDLFIHDSRHSERNLVFELEHARAAVRRGGVLIADDVDLNCGLHRFSDRHAEDRVIVCPAEPLRPDPGRQNDRGVFAVIMKGG